MADLAATGAVDSVDLKGAYKGTVVDQEPDPRLYRLVAEGFPDAWIEDPALTPETEPVLEPYHDRITWDAPIHSVADIEALPFPPRTINIKPSRFGSIEALFESYDYLAEKGIGAYGGGQFELGVGRRQNQYLASLFHPDAPNDLAPTPLQRERAAAGPARESSRAGAGRGWFRLGFLVALAGARALDRGGGAAADLDALGLVLLGLGDADLEDAVLV